MKNKQKRVGGDDVPRQRAWAAEPRARREATEPADASRPLAPSLAAARSIVAAPRHPRLPRLETSLSPGSSPGLALSLALSVVAGLALGCRDAAERARRDPKVAALHRSEVDARFPSQARLVERSGTGVVEYLGFDLEPSEARAGESVLLTHYFRVIRPLSRDYAVFVHGDFPGGGRVFVADHTPVLGRLGTKAWRTGEIWADPHRVLIPAALPGPGLEVMVGLFHEDTRLSVEAPPGKTDGRDRIRAAVLEIAGAKDDLPTARVERLRPGERIVPDGALDEPAWQRAEVLLFADSLGREGTPRFPTKLRLLYDDEHLYVAFECEDRDITERYSERDDPIYEHEAVELFLMPEVIAPSVGPYLELQASPGGVIFDASFVARRQGMDKGFDAGQTVGTTLRGTLNVLDTDEGWISEWRVPWTKLRGVTRPPRPGEEWRMNAFRIERFREGGNAHAEYTAWSPPRIGDFHNLARFGRMKFTEAQ